MNMIWRRTGLSAIVMSGIVLGGAAIAQQPAVKTRSQSKKTGEPTTKSARTAAGRAANGLTVEVIGLAINKEPRKAKGKTVEGGFTMMGSNSPGTRVRLHVAQAPGEIVGLDEQASEIGALRDDKGTNLAVEKQRNFGFGPFNLDQQEDKQTAIVEISQPGVPVAGATKINLKGRLVLNVGAGEKIVEQKNVALKKGSSITVGPSPLKISDLGTNGFGDTKVTITLETSQPLDAIKEIAFVDASGQEIKQENLGSGSFGVFGKTTYQRTIGLAKQVNSATVRIKQYEKIEPVAVPLELEIGVGL
jgi:hypothetical protein